MEEVVGLAAVLLFLRWVASLALLALISGDRDVGESRVPVLANM